MSTLSHWWTKHVSAILAAIGARRMFLWCLGYRRDILKSNDVNWWLRSDIVKHWSSSKVVKKFHKRLSCRVPPTSSKSLGPTQPSQDFGCFVLDSSLVCSLPIIISTHKDWREVSRTPHSLSKEQTKERVEFTLNRHFVWRWGRCDMTDILKRTPNAAKNSLSLRATPPNGKNKPGLHDTACVIAILTPRRDVFRSDISHAPSVMGTAPLTKSTKCHLSPKRVGQSGALRRRIRLQAAATLFLVQSQAMPFRHNDNVGSPGRPF